MIFINNLKYHRDKMQSGEGAAMFSEINKTTIDATVVVKNGPVINLSMDIDNYIPSVIFAEQAVKTFMMEEGRTPYV